MPFPPASPHARAAASRQAAAWALALSLVTATATACKSDSEFAGGASSGAGKGKLVQACSDEGATSSRLVTPELANGKKGNHVIYELSLTDCDGKPKSIADARIYFDVDGEHDSETIDVQFKLEAGGNTVSGVLDKVKGEDLFGKKGDKFFFFRSSKTASLDAETMPATIRFDLAGRHFIPYIEGKPTPDSPTMNTYMRIGDAASVENTVELR